MKLIIEIKPYKGVFAGTFNACITGIGNPTDTHFGQPEMAQIHPGYPLAPQVADLEAFAEIVRKLWDCLFAKVCNGQAQSLKQLLDTVTFQVDIKPTTAHKEDQPVGSSYATRDTQGADF